MWTFATPVAMHSYEDPTSWALHSLRKEVIVGIEGGLRLFH